MGLPSTADEDQSVDEAPELNTHSAVGIGPNCWARFDPKTSRVEVTMGRRVVRMLASDEALMMEAFRVNEDGERVSIGGARFR